MSNGSFKFYLYLFEITESKQYYTLDYIKLTNTNAEKNIF